METVIVSKSLVGKKSKIAYDYLCDENENDMSFLARTVTDGLIGDILPQYSRVFSDHFDIFTRFLQQIPMGTLFRPAVNWPEYRDKFGELIQQCNGNRRGIELAERAVNSIFYRLEQGESVSNVKAELTQTFICEALKADFSEKIRANEDREFVVNKVDLVEPIVIKEFISPLANQAIKCNTFDSLRQPSRKKPNIDLNGDIEDL